MEGTERFENISTKNIFLKIPSNTLQILIKAVRYCARDVSELLLGLALSRNWPGSYCPLDQNNYVLEWRRKKLISNSALWREKYWQGCSQQIINTNNSNSFTLFISCLFMTDIKRTFEISNSPPSPFSQWEVRVSIKIWSYYSPKSTVAFWYGLIFEHSHARLKSEFLLILGQAQVIRVQIHGRRSLPWKRLTSCLSETSGPPWSREWFTGVKEASSHSRVTWS